MGRVIIYLTRQLLCRPSNWKVVKPACPPRNGIVTLDDLICIEIK